MIKKTWIMWALFLMLPGLIGLGVEYAQKNTVQKRIALAIERIGDCSVAEEYVKMYEKWADLPAEEKVNNPWGYGLYGGSDIQNRLLEGQSDRLLADIQYLVKGFPRYPDELTDIIYGTGWQQQVEAYKKKQTTNEIMLVGSIFFLAASGLILTGGLSRLLVLYLIYNRRSKKAEKDEELGENAEGTATSDNDYEETEQDESVMVESSVPQGEPEEADDKVEQTDKSSSQKKHASSGYFQSTRKANQDSAVKKVDSNATELPMKPSAPITKKAQKDSYFGWALDSEESTELETLMTTEPLTKELTELTEEVSAIRQFASQQQDQMRKLQDGYDWMIIRRFCLRIIRSIDNIDDRVKRLNEQGDQAAAYLEDIRDELVFALEAGGIEQFRPDLSISFKGLEKYAEAVRDRVLTEDEELVGCIAEVARPGYQYLVNEDDVKIVRCAQVKLYDSK